MHFVKEMKIENHKIDLRLERGLRIDDYEIQLLNAEPHSLRITKDKRSKSHMVFDSSHLCSLKSYLQEVVLEETAFIKFLIDMLEGIQRIVKDHYLIATAETIFFSMDQEWHFLILPIVNEEFLQIDDEIEQLLIEIIQEVRLQDGYEILGLLVSHLKRKDIHCASLLQELHQHLPVLRKPSLLERIFLKKEIPKEAAYPPPCFRSKKQDISHYVEEIEEPGEKTMMLFQEEITGYLQDEQVSIPIQKKSFLIGRHPDSDCYLDIPSISKEHAVIMKEEDGFYIKDLHSSNATYVNGKKLKPMKPIQLHDSDEILLADTLLEFHDHP